MLVEISLLSALFFYIYHSWKRSYWSRRRVFSVPGEFLFGSTRSIITGRSEIGKFFQEAYDNHKDKKLIGFYNVLEPMLIVTDPQYILQIFISDYQSFPFAGININKKADPLINVNPFCVYGEEWKARRGLQVAIQTQSKMKENVPLMKNTATMMMDYIKGHKSKPIKISEISTYYTIDNVTSTAFGIEPSAFKDSGNSFRLHAGKEMLDSWFWLTSILSTLLPTVCVLFRFRMVSKSTETFFFEMADKIFNHRKSNKVSRNDLIDQLIKADSKKMSEGKKGLEPTEVAGHMMTTYIDSVETSSTFLSYILLEIANRPEVQDRLREEFQAAFQDPDRDLDYERVSSLQFLNMVFSEMLRLHPLLFYFQRVCMKDTKVGEVDIEKGTKIFIPYTCIVQDPQYFPDPEKFDPERFSPENIKSIIKGTYFPFGEGPKQCPGMKYATLQIKLAVIYLLMNFKLIRVDKTEKIEDTQELGILIKPKDSEQIIFEPI